jgi:hypothetical protein
MPESFRISRMRASARASGRYPAASPTYRSAAATRTFVDTAGIVAMACAARLVYGAGHLGADAAQGLNRGSELLHGRVPDYAPAVSTVVEQAAATAPTPHPLSYLVSGVASLFGQDAGYSVVVALSYLAFGALLWGTYCLGAVVFGPAPGAFATLAVGTSVPVAYRAASAGVDVWFIAVLMWALVIEARQPRCGRPVLLLLLVAGLLRPDAWILSAMYAAYLFSGLSTKQRVESALLVAAPALLWLAFDAGVTGDALYSLTHTQNATDTLDRPTGVTRVPSAFVDGIRGMLRLPVAIAGVLGVALALLTRRPRVGPMVAVLVAEAVAFVALGVAGLPLNDRYLFDIGAILSVFAGYLVFGWLTAAPAGVRLGWAAIGVVVLIAIAVKLPGRVDAIRVERADLANRARVANDLRLLIDTPNVRFALHHCDDGVEVFDARPVPYLAYLLNRPVHQLSFFRRDRLPTTKLVLVPEAFITRTFPNDPVVVAEGGYGAPRGFVRVSGNRTWSLYEPPGCT